MKKAKKQTLAKRLGLTRMEQMTKKACIERAAFLERRLKQGAYKGLLEAKARSHASWYRSKAKSLRKAA